jgi:hypothetical protein
MSADSSNQLIDVLSFYIFGELVVLPQSSGRQNSDMPARVNHWTLSDEVSLSAALHEALMQLLPGWSTDYVLEKKDSAYSPPPPGTAGPIDAGIVIIEIWTKEFVVRAWANRGDGAADCLPIFQSVIPMSGGFGPVNDTLIALMRRIAEGLRQTKNAQ